MSFNFKKNTLLTLMPACLIVPSIASLGTMLTSCSKTKHIESAEQTAYLIGNQDVTYLTYTLQKEIKPNQQLIIELDDKESVFYFETEEPVIESKLVSIPVYWTRPGRPQKRIQWTGDVTFTCKNLRTNKNDWQQTIYGSSVVYSPIVYFENKTQAVETLKSDNQLEFTFDLSLPEPLDTSVYTLKPHIHDYDTQNWSVEEGDAVIIPKDPSEGYKFELQIKATKKSTAVAFGDTFDFSVQVDCIRKTTSILIWQTENITSFSAYYLAAEKAIDKRDLVINDSNVLTGIQIQYSAEDYNTLLIPQEVTDIRFDSTIDEQIWSKIERISFAEGSRLYTISENSFKGWNNVKCIDFSRLGNDIKEVDQVEFKANSFAEWASEGKIIWNSEFSHYKRHILMKQLYSAGLTGQWYDITEVDALGPLKEACSEGASIKLMDDITIGKSDLYCGQIDIYDSLVIDLNGHKIKCLSPIFNYARREFAVFGIRDAEVIVTDSSQEHKGGIEVYDYAKTESGTRDISKELQYQAVPTKSNEYYEVGTDGQVRPRSTSCFYVRSDIPDKQQASLDILAGNYYANGCVITNVNTTCWIEEGYKTSEHKYAPTFNLYSSVKSDDDYYIDDMLWCKEEPSNITKFEIYGGKFYSKEISQSYTPTGTDFKWYDFNPGQTHHNSPKGEFRSWLAKGEGYEYIANYDADGKYYLVSKQS